MCFVGGGKTITATGTKVAHTSARAQKRLLGEALTVPVQIQLLWQDGVTVSQGALDGVGFFHAMSKVKNTKCHISAVILQYVC